MPESLVGLVFPIDGSQQRRRRRRRPVEGSKRKVRFQCGMANVLDFSTTRRLLGISINLVLTDMISRLENITQDFYKTSVGKAKMVQILRFLIFRTGVWNQSVPNKIEKYPLCGTVEGDQNMRRNDRPKDIPESTNATMMHEFLRMNRFYESGWQLWNLGPQLAHTTEIISSVSTILLC
jgi:hypothetical protein